MGEHKHNCKKCQVEFICPYDSMQYDCEEYDNLCSSCSKYESQVDNK